MASGNRTPASSAGVERVFSAAGKRCTRTSKSPPRLARSRRLSLPCRMCSSVGAGASRLPRGLLLVGATHAHSVGLLAACAVVAVNKLLIALGHSSITIKLIEYILLMVHSDSYLLMVIPCLGARYHITSNTAIIDCGLLVLHIYSRSAWWLVLCIEVR